MLAKIRTKSGTVSWCLQRQNDFRKVTADVGERARLTCLVRAAQPKSLAAAFSGSFRARPRHLVSDIDVVALVPGGAGEKEIIGSCSGLRVECTRYDPHFPSAVDGSTLPPLLLLREYRKLYAGRVLFGAPIMRLCRNLIGNLDVPKHALEQIADHAALELVHASPKEVAFVSLIKAFEAALFLNGCLYRSDGPSKPKWYFYDAIESSLGGIRAAVQSLVSVPQLAQPEELTHLIAAIETISAEPPLSTMKRDLVTLDRAGETNATRVLLMIILSRLHADQGRAEVALPEYFWADKLSCAEWYEISKSKLLEALRSLQHRVASADRIPVAHPLSRSRRIAPSPRLINGHMDPEMIVRR